MDEVLRLHPLPVIRMNAREAVLPSGIKRTRLVAGYAVVLVGERELSAGDIERPTTNPRERLSHRQIALILVDELPEPSNFTDITGCLFSRIIWHILIVGSFRFSIT